MSSSPPLRTLLAACALALSAAVTNAAAQTASAADLATARAAAERRDLAAALTLYEGLAAADPANADLLIELARVYGWADRNADAARIYRRVLELAPARRADVLPSLAWQALWSGDARGAAVLFTETAAGRGDRADALRGLGEARQALDDQPGALAAYEAALRERPGDRDLQRRRALSLLWNDRHGEAIAALQALQTDAPDDRATGWALANARNFAGRHREALRDFARLGAPRSAGERVDVARAWRWAGFEDVAAPLLAGQTDPEAVWLRDWRVARELAPFALTGVEVSEDRDRLRTRSEFLAAGWHPTAGQTAEISARHTRLDDPNGTQSGPQMQLRYRWRVGDVADGGSVAWPSVALGAQRFGDWHPLTGAAHVLWLPRDDLRIDTEAGRQLVATPLAIANRVTVDTLSASAEVRPTPAWSAAGALAALRFDDGNVRTRASGRADYALMMRPRWLIGVEAQAFDSSKPTGPTTAARGYWNPDRYREARLFTSVWIERRPWDAYARIGAGASREIDGFGNASSGRPHVWELALGYDLAATVRVTLSAGGSGGGLGFGSGGSRYWRRYATLNLSGWF